MKKRNAVILSAALGISASFCTYAADFGHEQTLTISGKPAYLAETSARVLANQNATAPELVEDITDGFGAKKIPGYKLMVMGRTYSMAAETKPPKQGQTQWRENAYVHRGIKLYLGIPVAGGKMDLANAKLINIGVVDDDGGSAPHVPEEKIRPVGKQLMGKDTKIEKAAAAYGWKRKPLLTANPSTPKSTAHLPAFIQANRPVPGHSRLMRV